MLIQKEYSNPIHFEKLNYNSLKVNFNKNLIIGQSFLKNDNIYLNNMDRTIFYFMKNKNKLNLNNKFK